MWHVLNCMTCEYVLLVNNYDCEKGDFMVR